MKLTTDFNELYWSREELVGRLEESLWGSEKARCWSGNGLLLEEDRWLEEDGALGEGGGMTEEEGGGGLEVEGGMEERGGGDPVSLGDSFII